jgi:hypothetical protein
MRVILNRGVAVIAGENAVKAGCMPGWINEDTLAGGGSHAGLAVACQAVLVLLE